MRLRTYLGLLTCAACVAWAGAFNLAPQIDAQQVYPIVRTTSATQMVGVDTNALSTTAEALATTLVTWECLVQNDPDSTTDILIGNATKQVIQLSPGQSFVIPIRDVSLIYAKAVSGTPVAAYICR